MYFSSQPKIQSETPAENKVYLSKYVLTHPISSHCFNYMVVVSQFREPLPRKRREEIFQWFKNREHWDGPQGIVALVEQLPSSLLRPMLFLGFSDTYDLNVGWLRGIQQKRPGRKVLFCKWSSVLEYPENSCELNQTILAIRKII